MGKYIPQKAMDLITYACPNLNKTILVNKVSNVRAEDYYLYHAGHIFIKR